MKGSQHVLRHMVPFEERRIISLKIAFIDTLLKVNRLEISSPVLEINLVDDNLDGDNDSHR